MRIRDSDEFSAILAEDTATLEYFSGQCGSVPSVCQSVSTRVSIAVLRRDRFLRLFIGV